MYQEETCYPLMVWATVLDEVVQPLLKETRDYLYNSVHDDGGREGVHEAHTESLTSSFFRLLVPELNREIMTSTGELCLVSNRMQRAVAGEWCYHQSPYQYTQ